MVINLSGSLLCDQIDNGEEVYERAGGIVNVARSIKHTSPEIEISMNATIGSDILGEVVMNDVLNLADHINVLIDLDKTSSAEIYSPPDGKTKIGSGDFRACRRVPKNNSKVDWTHVAYLNVLDYPFTFLGMVPRPFSVDFCSSVDRPITEKLFSTALLYADVIFISKEDIPTQRSVDSWSCHSTGLLVCHDTETNFALNRGDLEGCCAVNFADDVSILGAGDYFAGQFIVNILKSRSVSDSLDRATNDMTELLRELN